MPVDERLYKAIALGDAEAVDALLASGCSATDKDPDGFTALMHAVLVESSSEGVVARLIRAGVDINARDNGQRWTALAFAARDGKVGICDALLRAGAEVDATDSFGNTPLWRAASRSNTDVVDLLVANGANLDFPNHRGLTPRQILGGRVDG